MKIALRFLLALALVISATAVYAGETGSVSGTVKDGTGAPVPGATVKISGPQMPAGRTVVTTSSGGFHFQKLIPGEYRIETELAGLGKAVRQTLVTLDTDTQVALTLVQKATAEVTVTAEAVSVDLKSAEVSTIFSDKTLKSLPLPRSYTGLLSLVPGGASDPTFLNGYFNAGGTLQDNLFLIDGVNITNPGFGMLSIETNELDISEFSVKRGGINAETRAVGAVVNAVTKSGTNVVAGAVRIEAQPKTFSARPINTGLASTTDRYVPALSLGFPIMKDVLFGYVSARWRLDDQTDRSGAYGTLPDYKHTEQEYHGKITAYPNEKNFISVDGRYLPVKDSNYFGTLQDQPTAGYDGDNKDSTISASWNWFIAANSNLEAKYIHLTEQNHLQAQNDIGITPTWNPTNIAANGALGNSFSGTDGVYVYRLNNQNYKRDAVSLNASQFLDLGPTQHQIKVGAAFETSQEDLSRFSNGWGAIASTTATVAGKKAAYVATWYPDQSTQLSDARTYTFFLQDTLTWKRLSATVGFMVNRDEYAQDINGNRNNFLTFRYGQEFQPRVGLVYNADVIKGDKFYGSFGKYMDLNQKSSARSLAPNRIYQMDTYFDAAGAILQSAPRAATTGKTIDAGLKPTYLTDWIFGYSAPIANKWSVDAYWQYRNTEHFIDDIPGTFPASGPFHAANLDQFGATRFYRAVTAQVQRRYADHWSMDVSYTYSQFKGNVDYDQSGNACPTAGCFNTSSNLMDGQGLYVYDPNRYGYLTSDRPHVFKAFGSYEMFGITLGGNLRVQSGRAYEARGRAAIGGTSGYRYIEPAGSRRLPTWTNFDLLASYNIPISIVNLRLEGRILNLFNTQTTLNVNRLEYLDAFVSSPNAPLYAAPQGTTQPNANFEAPTSIAPPRRFVLTAIAEF
jgi:hypothetical protein